MIGRATSVASRFVVENVKLKRRIERAFAELVRFKGRLEVQNLTGNDHTLHHLLVDGIKWIRFCQAAYAQGLCADHKRCVTRSTDDHGVDAVTCNYRLKRVKPTAFRDRAWYQGLISPKKDPSP